MLLRESLATSNCHTTMIAHVSDEPARQAETLSTAQLAARIHRLRRKKVKVGPSHARPSQPKGPRGLVTSKGRCPAWWGSRAPSPARTPCEPWGRGLHPPAPPGPARGWPRAAPRLAQSHTQGGPEA